VCHILIARKLLATMFVVNLRSCQSLYPSITQKVQPVWLRPRGNTFHDKYTSTWREDATIYFYTCVSDNAEHGWHSFLMDLNFEQFHEMTTENMDYSPFFGLSFFSGD